MKCLRPLERADGKGLWGAHGPRLETPRPEEVYHWARSEMSSRIPRESPRVYPAAPKSRSRRRTQPSLASLDYHAVRSHRGTDRIEEEDSKGHLPILAVHLLR